VGEEPPSQENLNEASCRPTLKSSLPRLFASEGRGRRDCARGAGGRDGDAEEGGDLGVGDTGHLGSGEHDLLGRGGRVHQRAGNAAGSRRSAMWRKARTNAS
jgi:hypothetical protein